MHDDGALGPFFALTPLAPGTTGWSPLGPDLSDPRCVDAWLGRVRTRLAKQHGRAPEAVDRHALGSVLHLGMSARLVSPWLARALLCGDGFVPHVNGLWWCDDGTTTFPLGLAPGSAPRAEAATFDLAPRSAEPDTRAPDAASFADRLVERLLEPLAHAGLATSPHTIWGNAASAINGAVATLAGEHPGTRVAAAALARSCLAALPWAGAWTGDVASASFRRRSCCLAHALPGGSTGAVCGDCVLRERKRPARG